MSQSRNLNVAPATAPSQSGGSGAITGELPAYRRSERAPESRRDRWLTGSAALPLGLAFLVGMVGCTTLIVLDASVLRSGIVPHQPSIAGYLQALGSRLDFKTFLIALLAMTACYAGVVVVGRALPLRVVVGAIVLLHLIVLAGPILLSQDVFSYIAYARLGVEHGLNPFTHGPAAAAHDSVFPYVGIVWRHTPAAYGPLWTLASYPVAPLGLEASLWVMKVVAGAASLGTVWLVWRSARRLGRDPLLPTLLLGLNPLLIIYDVGGVHNDLVMGFFMMLGVWLTLEARDGLGAAAVIAGAAVKATCAVVLPFMLLSRRRLSLISGTVIALAAIAVVSVAVFGTHALDFVSVLRRQQSFVSTDSFPNEVAHLFGRAGVFPVDRALLRVALGLVAAYLLFRVWRGYDWISASGWTLLAIAVTTTWLLAWYVIWTLPLAVIARDRRLLWATLAVGALFIAHQTSPLFSPL